MAALYGKLNMEMTPIRYTGKDTDTATVSVDNKNKTIEVSVKNVYTKEEVDKLISDILEQVQKLINKVILSMIRKAR